MLNNDLHLETDIVDEMSGQRQPGFKFQFMNSKGKKKGKELIVLPEQAEQCQILLDAFARGSQSTKAADQLIKQSSKDATEE